MIIAEDPNGGYLPPTVASQPASVRLLQDLIALPSVNPAFLADPELHGEHRVADHLEHEINVLLGNAHVVSHIDPCQVECPGTQECARMKQIIREFAGQGRDGQKRRKP